MKVKLTLVVFLILKAFAAQSCPMLGNPDKVQSMSLRGAKVYALFTPHLFGEDELVLGALSAKTRPEIKKKLLQLLDDNKAIIDSEKADSAQITSLAKSGEIAWIGIEASAEEMRSGISIASQVEDYRATKKLYQEFLGGVKKTSDLMYLIFPADIIARAENSEAFAKIRTIPLDSHLPKQQMFKTVEEAMVLSQSLFELGSKMHLIAFKDFETLESLYQNALLNSAPLDEQTIVAATGGIKNAETKTLAIKYLEAANKFLTLSAKRDAYAANAIVGLSGNGLVTFGSAHGPGISSRLNIVCLMDTANPWRWKNRIQPKVK